MDKNLPANAEDAGVSSDSGRFHVPSNSEACAPHLLRPACSRPASCSYWALKLQLLKTIHLEPVPPNKRSQCPPTRGASAMKRL